MTLEPARVEALARDLLLVSERIAAALVEVYPSTAAQRVLGDCHQLQCGMSSLQH